MLIYNKIKSKNSSVLILFFLLVFSFILLNVATSLFVGNAKLDISKDKIYSLSPASIKLMNKLNTPINVRLFMSEDIENDYPELKQYAGYIIRFLEEYRDNYSYPFEIEVVTVTPFSSSEKDAINNNIRGFVGRDGRTNFYFGMVISDSLGTRKIIPYLKPERQNYLEQDISRILAHFQENGNKKIGIISPTLPIINSGRIGDETKDWAFIRILKNDYDVKKISNNEHEIIGYDAIIIINPQKLSNNIEYAIDQYLMNDGRVIIFMDPFAEMDISANNIISPDNSDITPMLKNWGINYQDNVIVGDDNLSEPALLSLNRIGNFPYWLKLNSQQMHLQDINTNNLQQLNFKTAGIIEVTNPFEKNKQTILLNTTNQGGVSRSDFVKYNPRDVSQKAFESDGLQYNLAVLSEGQFMSNYSQPLVSNINLLMKMEPFRVISNKNSKLLVVTDSDFLATANWSQNFISNNESIYDLLPKNNNMDFLLSITDYMSGNENYPIIARNIHSTINGAIEKVLNNKYTEQEAENISVLSNNILYNKDIIADMENSRNQIKLADTVFLEKLEKHKHNLSESEEKLKYIDYKINQKVKREINIFIWCNILFFPLLLLAIIKIISILYAKYINKRAGRICE